MKPWVFIAAMLLAAGHVDAKTLKGMNLAGAAYSADVLPGRPEVDFTYPTGQELDYFAKKGMTIVRVPVLWERLQPDLGGELDGAELARLVSIIGSAEAYGMRVVVDIHNYGAYRSALVGTGAVSADQFAAFWARLARHLKAHGNAMFGLMNEPQQGDAQAWMIIIQKTIDAIWAVGAEQLILVAGTAWDGVHSFVQVSGPFAARLHDPLQRTWFEMHEVLRRELNRHARDMRFPRTRLGPVHRGNQVAERQRTPGLRRRIRRQQAAGMSSGTR